MTGFRALEVGRVVCGRSRGRRPRGFGVLRMRCLDCEREGVDLAGTRAANGLKGEADKARREVEDEGTRRGVRY